MDIKNLSKFLSLILRHEPSVIGITLDHEGWANVSELIEKVRKHGYSSMTSDTLDTVVDTDNKQRYSYNADKTKIRANQGHSINVDVGLKEQKPPDILYHGTATRFLDSIHKSGLLPQSRQYVHLSDNEQTAKTVGVRHGSPVILKIDANKMYNDGIKFYLSENKVWLTKKVHWVYFINEKD